MPTLPQELVDEVIDELVKLNCFQIHCIAPYSLVSRAWVTRTQQHCFECVYLDDLDMLERWRRKIVPDPAGVSRHTRELILAGIDMLEGFEAHIRAFTRVEAMDITGCKFLLSPSAAECFVPMGSNLTQLRTDDSETTSRAITSLLAGFPKLKDFNAENLKVTDDACGTNLISRIPFFEGNNSARLCPHFDQQDPPGPPDWIPPSARFGDLEIDTTYFLHKTALVNQWLSGSCTTLTSLTIFGDLDVLFPNPFIPLDLSPCLALVRLCISMQLYNPGIIIETVLPSITLSQLSHISLQSEDDPNNDEYLEIDYPAWVMAENHLRRLAKHFSAKNPGEKMEVFIFMDGPYDSPEMNDFVERVSCKQFLPRLREEAIVNTIKE